MNWFRPSSSYEKFDKCVWNVLLLNTTDILHNHSWNGAMGVNRYLVNKSYICMNFIDHQSKEQVFITMDETS